MALSKQATADIYAVLTTLEEEKTAAPETIIYIALGSDMQRYEAVKNYLAAGKLANFANHQIELTQIGHELALKLIAYIAALKG